MKRKEQTRSPRQLISFTWMRGVLLMVLLSIMGIGSVNADTRNPEHYFVLDHEPTVDKPYIDWHYLLKDNYGADDIESNTHFYIGWTEDGKTVEKEILYFNIIHQNVQRYNTQYGVGYVCAEWTDHDLYLARIRFYPSDALGSGVGSALKKSFYIRMKGQWDVDWNGSIDNNIDEKRYLNNSEKTEFYDQTLDIVKTPAVTFTRDGQNHVTATATSGKFNAVPVEETDGNKGGGNWTAYLGVTYSDKETQTSGTYYTTTYGSLQAESNGSLSKGFTMKADENISPIVYYHKFLKRTTKVDGIEVKQTIQGPLLSKALPSFLSPIGFKPDYKKYEEKTDLSWTNKAGSDNNGEYYIFRNTNKNKSGDNLTWTKLGTASSNETSFTDNTAKIGNYYTYAIMFVPNSYTAKPSAPNGSSKLCQIAAEVGAEKTFNVAISSSISTTGTGGILLKWTPDYSKVPLNYSLKRYDPVNHTWNEIYSGGNTSYTDQSNLETFNTYKYKVETTYWTTAFASQELSVYYASMTDVSDLRTSRGNYSNVVKVSWKAKQQGTGETRFVVSRRALNDPNSVYEDVYEVYGTASSYFFDDISALPGMFYMYRVIPYARIPNTDNWGAGNTVEADGFCQSRGIISGRVTFGTGTAVEGVKVHLEKIVDETSGNDDRQQFYSLHTNSTTGALAWTPSEQALANLQGSERAYTIQMWAKTNPGATSTSGKRSILSVPGQLSLYLVNDAEDASRYGISVALPGGSLQATGLTVPTHVFNNISLSNDGKGHYVVRVVGEEQVDSVAIASATALNWSGRSLVIGGNNVGEEVFDGYVDDIRVWSRCLSNKELLANYDRILSGTEKGLMCYWPLDEGIERLPFAYDYSKKNGTSNGNHATVQPNVRNTTVTPTSEQLSLYGLTNSEGGYEINGIPFTGDGTSYIVRPEKGIHEFNPKYVTRFVNNNSLTHSGVDFEDVSSFPVSGVVYYEHTTYPVEGCYVYVDGQLAVFNGQAVTTDVNGEFAIDVPIGSHSIKVKLTDHTFADAGRYPADPQGIGTTYEFTRTMTGLTFYDTTKQVLAGRVVGGVVEDGNPLGFGESKANIGQAVIRLSAGRKMNVERVVDGASVRYDNASERLVYAGPNTDVRSEAYVEGGDDDAVSTIVIRTDAKSGEFVAHIPPVPYEVTSVVIPSNSAITFAPTHLDVPMLAEESMNCDTLTTEGGSTREFHYHNSLKLTHRSTPVLEVTNPYETSAPTAYGEPVLYLTDDGRHDHEVEAYTIDGETGKVTYAYGYPVFYELGNYAFQLYGYERYINNDAREDEAGPVVDDVPLDGVEVTISNQFSTAASVRLDNGEIHELEDNVLTLDEEGRALYCFRAGLPNIVSPYTRTMSIAYEVNDTHIAWNGGEGLAAIVVGTMPSGNNFVTAGPDKVSMILRDPPGSKSYASIAEGTEMTVETTHSFTYQNKGSKKIDYDAGPSTKTSNGVGIAIIEEAKVFKDKEYGYDKTKDNVSTSTDRTTTTFGTTITTSADPEYVGAVGDVFVGNSTNYVFGDARKVMLGVSAQGEPTGVSVEDIVTVSEGFVTSFNYTQHYVENTLIPNFIKMRDTILLPKGTEASYNFATLIEPVYISNLDVTDPNYATSNSDTIVWGKDADQEHEIIKHGTYEQYKGDSYDIYFPANYVLSDTILWYNQQIEKWQETLRTNEEAKVKAITERQTYLDRNVSFDSGAKYAAYNGSRTSHSEGKTTKSNISIIKGSATGFKFNSTGIVYQDRTTYSFITVDGSEETNIASKEVAYTMEETGTHDALSVDVFNAPDGFGPIFVTRAGQTSAPYEDRVVTRYYEPGTEISAKTMQIEMPQIAAESTIVTGVPSGGAAQFTLLLSNLSETGTNVYFGLGTVETRGATILMDGVKLGENSTVYVPAHETVKRSLQVRQSDESVLDYEDIKIRLFSQSQNKGTDIQPAIADTVSLSAYFQPACSQIALAASTSLINVQSGTDLRLSASAYDVNYRSLTGVRLMYRGESDTQWKVAREYVTDDELVTAQREKLPTGSVEYVLDMSNANVFPDQTYYFQAVTVCNFGGIEVEGESDVVTVTKDVTRPQLIAAPSPASGILTPDGELALLFNEDIRSSALNKADNFIVTSRLNGAEVDHATAFASTAAGAARTEALIDLPGGSFALDFWLKYTESGTIVQHGTTEMPFTLGLDADGHLTVTTAEGTVASTVVLPKDKWTFYDADGAEPVLTAHCAYDQTAETLFLAQPMPAYAGRSALSLGGGFKGALHEVSLWNYARPWLSAQAEMNERKSSYTRGLMGYWPLDEGHGTVAEDVARSRHLTLPAASAWYSAEEGMALGLDGALVALAPMGCVATTADESYLVEMWFRADADQEGAATIFATSDGKMELGLDADGKMLFTLGGQPYSLDSYNYNDGGWHHAAFNVLKSLSGSATVYIDGKPLRQFPAQAIPALQAGYLALGGGVTADGDDFIASRMMKGAVDEVRIWKGVRTADVIKANMYSRVSPDAPGLAAYFPFETLSVDGAGQSHTAFCTTDLAAGQESAMTTTTGSAALQQADDAPALKAVAVKQNVSFDFVSSERKLLINLTEDPAAIEGCTVDVTVRGVRDSHGNLTDDNITWSAYVQQNRLKWTEHAADLRKEAIEPVSFTATIANNSGVAEQWSLSGLPSWLTVSQQEGTLAPLAQRTLTFTVDPALAIGRYEAVVYLTGSLGIPDALVVNVVSVGEMPDWSVNKADYEFTMNIAGQLKIDGVLSTDTEDIVAAFRGLDCVGVASPFYVSRNDAYYIMMTVYGNAADNSTPLSYRVYDASTGTVYPAVTVTPAGAGVFEADAVIGSLANPVMFEPEEKIEQDIDVVNGWRWISLYVEPDDMTPSAVFNDCRMAVNSVTNGKATATASETDITGDLVLMNCAEMYKVNGSDDVTLPLIGCPADAASVPITLFGDGRWTWVGYPLAHYTSLASAFADADPTEGDVVKTQSAFCIYSSGEWIGTLLSMVPGEGYQYRRMGPGDHTFRYPAVAYAGTSKQAPMVAATGLLSLTSRDNMNMIVEVVKGETPVTDATIEVYCGTALRGRSLAPDHAHLHMLTVAGPETDDEVADRLVFVVTTDEGTYYIDQQLAFTADAVLGSPSAPYRLQLDGCTSIDELYADSEATRLGLQSPIYDLLGRRAASARLGQLPGTHRKAVMVKGGVKTVR